MSKPWAVLQGGVWPELDGEQHALIKSHVPSGEEWRPGHSFRNRRSLSFNAIPENHAVGDASLGGSSSGDLQGDALYRGASLDSAADAGAGPGCGVEDWSAPHAGSASRAAHLEGLQDLRVRAQSLQPINHQTSMDDAVLKQDLRSMSTSVARQSAELAQDRNARQSAELSRDRSKGLQRDVLLEVSPVCVLCRSLALGARGGWED